jgi:hypothetical protein
MVMKLINKRILQPTDFSWPTMEGGVYLTDPARRVFLKHFEDRMSEKTSHPDLKGSVSYRRVIQLQVRRYVKALLGSSSYEPFLRWSDVGGCGVWHSGWSATDEVGDVFGGVWGAGSVVGVWVLFEFGWDAGDVSKTETAGEAKGG